MGGFRSSSKLLAGVVVGAYGLLLPVAIWMNGVQGTLEAGAAAMICFMSGITALAATWHLSRQQQPLVGLLIAMALRMLPPLIICVALALQGTGADYLGFVCYLLTFYLVTLAAETYASVQLAKPHQKSAG